MSFQQMTSPKQMLLSQVMIIMFSAAMAFLPRQYYMLLIVAYILILPVIITKMNMRPGAKGGDPQEIERGAILYEEKNAQQIMVSDTKLTEEIQAQLKGMTLSMALFPIIIAWFWLYGKFLFDPVQEALFGGSAGRFLSTLILFEGSFVISRISAVALRGRVKQAQMIVMPNSYKVTSKGIVSKGLGSRVALRFPLKDYELVLNPKRKFVELVPKDEKMRARGKIRLYARDPYKLHNILQRYVGEED